MRSKSVRSGVFVALVVMMVVANTSPVHAKRNASPIRTDAHGNVARWDPCSPLKWKVGDGVNRGVLWKSLLTAIQQLNNSTGLNFQYAGIATAIEMQEPPTNTLVVTLSDSFPRPLVAGTTRVKYASGVNDSIVIVGASIKVNSRIIKGQLQGLVLPVLLHELGHVVGLAHVDDSKNIMYPRAIRAMKYKPNEVSELAMFGASAGCHPVQGSANL